MKPLKILLLLTSLLILMLASELIFFYRNEPEKLGKLFLNFALSEAKQGNYNGSIANIDRAAFFYFKQSGNDYRGKDIGYNQIAFYPTNENPRKEILNNLTKSIPLVLEKESISLVSNIYYNLGLIAYSNKFYKQASNLFLTAVSMDYKFGHLHVELANSYFYRNMFEKGIEILKKCKQFKYPKKQCQEYLETNVRLKVFLPIGIYKKIIDDYQSN